ncbi:hypothetical protein HYH03_011714 [Edaphochlamys debaryana]|uniref:EGF-like domain-containing protein n=1 Tax=Edaphochlamys debaryana TaxID=47281 RepID=A0A836BW50_9CHLO|nr:hypothetical protein HYH03_011714 [Edaphochlamys debaryana]|eukprot:KAG2489763.1 hypothetical protein HYH03_011714 [Edaphochlamys debaryana]
MLLTATHPEVGLDSLFQPSEAQCHPDCTKRGNCNRETGQCECPYGFTGPTCEEGLIPACQTDKDSEPFFGVMIPRSCACVRQMQKMYGCSPGPDYTCTHVATTYHPVKCYEFVNKTVEEQWSQMPYANATGVQWRQGQMSRKFEPQDIPGEDGVIGNDIWWRPYLSLPLDRCQVSCLKKGACVIEMDRKDGQLTNPGREPFCLCYKGYEGDKCQYDMRGLCPNECGGRGKCYRGFCHCEPPFWGLGCARERAWALRPGAVPIPNRAKLRIYVYDLPSNIAFPLPLDDSVTDMNFEPYGTDHKFLELLLKDPSVRTENPLEANLFFVPARSYAYTSNTNSPHNQIKHVMDYVMRTWPYFNASGGRDHLVWTTGDRGSCSVKRELSRVIHMTLFGVHASVRPSGPGTFLDQRPTLHPDWGCLHPGKDIVAAPSNDHTEFADRSGEIYAKLKSNNGQAPNRTALFFFAGGVRFNEPAYSGGARQELALHLKKVFNESEANYTDVTFKEGYIDDYKGLYLHSKFCLAPHGFGFGIRLTEAMLSGCIPVIIQDTVYQPYEADGILPYHKFSVRLPKSDIPNIVPILRSIPIERQNKMRMEMVEYHRAFLWDPSLGGQAYNYTIRALEQRVNGVVGRLWALDGPGLQNRRRRRGGARRALRRGSS